MDYKDFKVNFKELVSEIEISNEAYEFVLAEAKLFFIKDSINNSILSKNKKKLSSKPVTRKRQPLFLKNEIREGIHFQ